MKIYEVWQKSNETNFLFTIFLNIKIVRLDSYTTMETLFPLLIAALEIFSMYVSLA